VAVLGAVLAHFGGTPKRVKNDPKNEGPGGSKNGHFRTPKMTPKMTRKTPFCHSILGFFGLFLAPCGRTGRSPQRPRTGSSNTRGD
jgi:hypothetical protein